MAFWIQAPESGPDVLGPISYPDPESVTPDDVVHSRVNIWTPKDHLPQLFAVSVRSPNGHGEFLCSLYRHTYFIYSKIRIGADYCSCTEVHPFTRKVASEPSFFAL